MKTPMVKTSPLNSMVLSSYHFSQMFEQPELVLNLPKGWNIDDYQSIELNYLGSWEEYNRMHHFEESELYCHIFILNGKPHKDYILCARKDLYVWKVECYLGAANTQIDVTDFVPVGYTFGSFFPMI